VRIRNLCTEEDTTYTYDTNCRLSKLVCKTTNGVVTKYVYGKGLIGEEVGGAFKTYHFDCRGSTIAITDASGNITDTFAYDTYGKLISRTGTSEVIFGYNGRDGVVTDDNGLIYMRARYYSPDMRRFVNADILHGNIADSTTLNRYSYVNGNPVSFVDPFGLSKDRGNDTDELYETITEILKNCSTFGQIHEAQMAILRALCDFGSEISVKANQKTILIKTGTTEVYWKLEVGVGTGQLNIDANKLIDQLTSEDLEEFLENLGVLDYNLAEMKASISIGDYIEYEASAQAELDHTLSVLTLGAEHTVTVMDDYETLFASTVGIEKKISRPPTPPTRVTVPVPVVDNIKVPSYGEFDIQEPSYGILDGQHSSRYPGKGRSFFSGSQTYSGSGQGGLSLALGAAFGLGLGGMLHKSLHRQYTL